MSTPDEPNRVARAQYVCESTEVHADGCWKITKHTTRVCSSCRNTISLREIHARWAHTIGEEDQR